MFALADAATVTVFEANPQTEFWVTAQNPEGYGGANANAFGRVMRTIDITAMPSKVAKTWDWAREAQCAKQGVGPLGT